MDVTVQHRLNNIQHYNNCTTVKDLRKAIVENPNYCCHSDISDWKLFYLGVQLDDEEELKDLNPDLTKKPFIILEEPPDIQRWGRHHTFITDKKTRFLVRGNRREYKVTAIRPKAIASYECPLEYYFLGNQTFGIITNVQRDGEVRKLEIAKYQLPMMKEGSIMLWEDPMSNAENRTAPEVHLITDREENLYEVLEPTTFKVYEEAKMKSENARAGAKNHIQEILEEFEIIE